MIKSTGFLVLSLFIFASLADVSNGNETALHKRRSHKKDAKLEYYLNRHVDHPDVDAETIQKHGASLEDAKMQADGLLEPKSKKDKGLGASESTGGEAGAKLQEIAHGEEKQHQRRRHHRHEAKVHEESKSEGSVTEELSKKEGIKEKKLTKIRKNVDSKGETSKPEEAKADFSKDTESPKQAGGKRNHDKRKKGHRHGFQSHKNKKHGGKKSQKPLGKPSKEKKDRKMHKNNQN